MKVGWTTTYTFSFAAEDRNNVSTSSILNFKHLHVDEV
jgi:hypothetical protein